MGKHVGKVAIVTGGGGGIGAAVCEVFAREGAKVAVLDLDQALANESAERLRELGGEAQPYRADVSSSGEVDEVFAQVHADFLRGQCHFRLLFDPAFLGHFWHFCRSFCDPRRPCMLLRGSSH